MDEVMDYATINIVPGMEEQKRFQLDTVNGVTWDTITEATLRFVNNPNDKEEILKLTMSDERITLVTPGGGDPVELVLTLTARETLLFRGKADMWAAFWVEEGEPPTRSGVHLMRVRISRSVVSL